jgi:hypothetical protein
MLNSEIRADSSVPELRSVTCAVATSGQRRTERRLDGCDGLFFWIIEHYAASYGTEAQGEIPIGGSGDHRPAVKGLLKRNHSAGLEIRNRPVLPVHRAFTQP